MEGQNNFLLRYEKPLRIALIALIVVSILLILVFVVIIPATQKANQVTTMEFGVAPVSATIDVDGKTYNSGVYEGFAPGTYTATITATGFETKTVEFTVVEHQANTLFTYLYNPEEGFDYFLKSDTDIATLSKIDDPEVQEWLAAYNQTLTIRDQLPVDVLFEYSQPYQYTDASGNVVIDARPATNEVQISDGSAMTGCVYTFCLWVDLGSVTQEVAAPFVEEEIINLGYNPDDYYIIYQ